MPHAKIKQALSFVREAQDLENTANASSSWETLEESAAKYNLAAYYLKNYARGIVRQVSNGSSDSEESTKTKDYLVGKIAEFEKKANELLVRVGNLKAEEQQQREQQLRQEQLWQEQQRKEQLRQEEQRQEQLHQEEQRKEQQQQQRNHIPRRHESEGGNSSCGASELEATANKLLTAAMDHEKSGEVIEALTSYVKAADFYLRATTESLMSPERVEKFKRITTNILGRVDELKRQIQGIDTDRSHSPKPETSRQYSNGNQPDKLTPDEIKVLTWSSTIASKVFVPWIEEEARAYNYSPPQPWIDPDGVLKLSEKQKETFFKWKRPSEILAMRRQTLRNITMIDTITPDTIKQYCVSDCSFIAGLCISAEFERRFKRRLITSLIHPQDPNTGKPIYNPKGVYMVKLWFNGVERRVLVDDLLPVDKGGELLCSHTKNKDGCLELWVPILEKAYMKLCGGYDFPGSNSGVDLFCLTGWIPERIYFPEDPADVKDFETPAERAWTRLSNAYRFGDCLATVSTSNGLPEEEAERKGLFTRHAYAVLKIVQLSNGTKLLQLKNPWASKVIRLHVSSFQFLTNLYTLSAFRQIMLTDRGGKVHSWFKINTAGVILPSAKKLAVMLILLQPMMMEFFGCRGMTSSSIYATFTCRGDPNCFNVARKSMGAGMQMRDPKTIRTTSARILSIQLHYLRRQSLAKQLCGFYYRGTLQSRSKKVMR